jgi:sulfite exporter TauE/SafE
MLQPLSLVGFLSLGLLGGAGHCLGMCLPFVLIVERRFGTGRPSVRGVGAQLQYAGGRVFTYVVLGAVAGAAGSVLQLAGGLVGLQRAAAIVAGSALILSGAASLAGVGWATGPGAGRWFGWLGGLGSGGRLGRPWAMGLALGLLPCGLVYSALIAAAGLGSPVAGAAGLLVFGLGTVPALLTASLADQFLRRQRRWVDRVSQVVIVSMGGWFVWRGVVGF